MVAYIGQIVLWIALGLSVLQMYPHRHFMAHSAVAIFALVLVSFGLLVSAYITSDFSILNVYLNSHTEKPLLYKITGTWGNHEGSMLLLTLILSLYNAIFVRCSNMREKQSLISTNIMGLVLSGFIAFIIFTSNPFEQMFPIPSEGQGLNPLLQDIGLAIHPPVLYLGYMSFTIVFAMACGAIFTKKVDKAFAIAMLPWVQFGWLTLTLGIGLGSWWAYRELGWGGYWFWDPVENASLMPWLVATALLHSLIALLRHDTLRCWTLFLALLTFTLGLLSIFLVRSGILTSVHSFTNEPERGMYILGFMAVMILIGFGGLAKNGSRLNRSVPFEFLSREGFILLNNALLLVACAVVILGTLYPLLVDAIGGKQVSVGAPYFNSTVLPILLPLGVLSYIGSILRWQRDTFTRIKWRFILPTAIMAALFLFIHDAYPLSTILFVAGVMVGLWLIVGMLLVLMRRIRLIAIPFRDSMKLLRKQTYGFYGMLVGHIGMAILILGVSYASTHSQSRELTLTEGESAELEGYRFTLDRVSFDRRDNYIFARGEFSISDTKGYNATLYPEHRVYHTDQTTEAAIDYGIFRNLYVVIGESDTSGSYAVRLYVQPLINWIWTGCFLMALGACISLLKRRMTS